MNRILGVMVGVLSSRAVDHEFEPRSGQTKGILGVMIGVLFLMAVDHEFEPRSGQTKDYIICICCFFAKHVALRSKIKA